MVPLLLGVLWDDILSRQIVSDLPNDVHSAAIEIGKSLNGYIPADLHIPEFELIAGQYPADTALQGRILFFCSKTTTYQPVTPFTGCTLLADYAPVPAIYTWQPRFQTDL